MAEVRPFFSWRPAPEYAAEVAAAPYDTCSRAEAAKEIAAHPLSFMRIDKPAALFDEDVDEYSAQVYEQAARELHTWYEEAVMVPDNEQGEPAYFVYRLTQGTHAQTGIMACVSVADYNTGVIKRHENTRALKETDRIKHIEALEAHTGPVLITYPSSRTIDVLLSTLTASETPLYDFVAPDGVRHELWRVSDKDAVASIGSAFAAISRLYIADGHHRAAAASQVATHFDSAEYPESQYFLSLIVGSDEMQVLDYNRVISDLADTTAEDLLAAIDTILERELVGSEPYKPEARGEYSMYLAGEWHKLRLPEGSRPADPVEGLDVALLHSMVLKPLLAIDDPRSNPRISYVGGIRGLQELAERADKTGGVAFALYPCSLEELFAVADADRLMPPKSTWFEPKPRSGLAIHRITE